MYVCMCMCVCVCVCVAHTHTVRCTLKLSWKYTYLLYLLKYIYFTMLRFEISSNKCIIIIIMVIENMNTLKAFIELSM